MTLLANVYYHGLREFGLTLLCSSWLYVWIDETQKQLSTRKRIMWLVEIIPWKSLSTYTMIPIRVGFCMTEERFWLLGLLGGRVVCAGEGVGYETRWTWSVASLFMIGVMQCKSGSVLLHSRMYKGSFIAVHAKSWRYQQGHCKRRRKKSYFSKH